MVGYLIMMLILTSAIGSVGAFVVQSVNVAHRRNDMISARQYAQGGVAISCGDLNAAFLNRAGGGFPNNLGTFSYAVVSSNSTQTVYQRTISSPFTNQTVTAQICLNSA